MRLLYIASKPIDGQGLSLKREITDLQQRLTTVAPAETIELKFLPALPLEALATEVAKYAPTILHISAHLDARGLEFSIGSGKPVMVSGQKLAALLNISNPPTIVYLNACNSIDIAQEVSRIGAIAIGTTAPITNGAARASAGRFYEILFGGGTVAEAFENSKALLNAVSQNAKTELFASRSLHDPAHLRLVELFQIVARFNTKGKVKQNFQANNNGAYTVQYGLLGCPADTTIVSFFSDERISESSDDYTIGYSKGPPTRGKLWGEKEDVKGDFRIAAAALTSSGRVFSTSCMLAEALELYFNRNGYRGLSQEQDSAFANAVERLRKSDDF